MAPRDLHGQACFADSARAQQGHHLAGAETLRYQSQLPLTPQERAQKVRERIGCRHGYRNGAGQVFEALPGLGAGFLAKLLVETNPKLPVGTPRRRGIPRPCQSPVEQTLEGLGEGIVGDRLARSQHGDRCLPTLQSLLPRAKHCLNDRLLELLALGQEHRLIEAGQERPLVECHNRLRVDHAVAQEGL